MRGGTSRSGTTEPRATSPRTTIPCCISHRMSNIHDAVPVVGTEREALPGEQRNVTARDPVLRRGRPARREPAGGVLEPAAAARGRTRRARALRGRSGPADHVATPLFRRPRTPRSRTHPPDLDRAAAGSVPRAHRSRDGAPRNRRYRGAVRRDARRRLGRGDRPDGRADADPGPLPASQRKPDGRLLDVADAGCGLAAATAVPLERLFDDSWRAALAVFAVPAIVAALLWLPPAARERTVVRHAKSFGFHNLARSWSLAAYFGLQSMAFYCGLTWLPTILQDDGYSKAAAGSLQALGNRSRSRRRCSFRSSRAGFATSGPCCWDSSRSRRRVSWASCSRRERRRSG